MARTAFDLFTSDPGSERFPSAEISRDLERLDTDFTFPCVRFSGDEVAVFHDGHDGIGLPRIGESPRLDLEPWERNGHRLRVESAYQDLAAELGEVLRGESWGRFRPLPAEFQYIPMGSLGRSRKLLCSHEAYPGAVFVLGGIGQVILADDSVIRIERPDAVRTPRDVASSGAGYTLMETGYIGRNGQRVTEVNDDPLGAYSRAAATRKAEMSKKAARQLAGVAAVPDMVASASYRSGTAEFAQLVYRLPAYVLSVDVVKAALYFDSNYDHYGFIYETAVHHVGRALQRLHSLDLSGNFRGPQSLTHNQLHPGNWGVTMGAADAMVPVLCDFASAQDLRSYKNRRYRNLARWDDLQHFLLAALNVVPESTEVSDNIAREIMILGFGIAGYKGIEDGAPIRAMIQSMLEEARFPVAQLYSSQAQLGDPVERTGRRQYLYRRLIEAQLQS